MLITVPRINTITTTTNTLNATYSMFSIEHIITLLDSKSINLDTDYQREIVWSDDKFEGFIDSCFHKVIPNPVILNKLETRTPLSIKYNCIDGKHRITALSKYVNNEISFKINGMNYYYNKITGKNSVDKIILNDSERNEFNSIMIPVVIYNCIEQEDEHDIFNRIQLGKPMACGELVLSNFTNAQVKLDFVKYCDSYVSKLNKYISTRRKQHYEFILFLIRSIDLNRLINASVTELRNFVKSLTPGKFKDLSLRLAPVINYIFSNDVLLNTNFKIPKIELNALYSVTFFFFKRYYDKFPNSTDSVKVRNLIRSTIEYQQSHGTNKLILSEFTNINKHIEDMYKKKGMDAIVIEMNDDDCQEEENNN